MDMKLLLLRLLLFNFEYISSLQQLNLIHKNTPSAVLVCIQPTCVHTCIRFKWNRYVGALIRLEIRLHCCSPCLLVGLTRELNQSPCHRSSHFDVLCKSKSLWKIRMRTNSANTKMGKNETKKETQLEICVQFMASAELIRVNLVDSIVVLRVFFQRLFYFRSHANFLNIHL